MSSDGQHPASGDTTGRHGMLLFGDDPVYPSHLPMYMHPHNFQVLLEAGLPPAALAALRADREQHGDGMYTFNPDPFPIADLEPRGGIAVRTAMTGTLVRGHFEHGGIPIATRVPVDIPHVPWFRALDGKPALDNALRYLCFGGGEQVYLAHELQGRPNFDQILAVRFVPGTIRDLIGHPLDDDVAALRFADAQPIAFGRDDGIDQRLSVGEVATASFALTRSPGLARGFTVGIEVERELYLEIDELS